MGSHIVDLLKPQPPRSMDQSLCRAAHLDVPASNCAQYGMTHGRRILSLFRGALPDCITSRAADDKTRIAIVIPWFQPRSDVGQTALRADGQARDPHIAPTVALWLKSAAANADIADFFVIYDPEGRPIMDKLLPLELPHNIRRIEVESIARMYEAGLNLR